MTDLATAKHQTDKDKCVMLMPIPILILSTEGSASVYLSNGIIMTDAKEAILAATYTVGKYREIADLETGCQLRDTELIRDNPSQTFPFLRNIFSRCGISLSLAWHIHG